MPKHAPSVYVPLDANYLRDPRIRRAGPDAELLYLRALAHAKAGETDAIRAWRETSGIPVSQGFCETLGVAKTNGPERQPGTVLATPIPLENQEDYPRW